MSRLTIILAAAGLLLATLLHSTRASADMLPPGYKGAKASIQISGELPQDSVLVLANTFNGATPLEVGKPAEVSWHPLSGDLELVLVKRASLKHLAELSREKDARWAEIRKYSTSCSKPFIGVRSVKADEPYDEVRWYYEAQVKGSECTSKLVRTAYLAKGEEVSVPGATPSSETTPSAAPSTLPPGTAAPSPPTKPAASGGCSGCATSRSAPASAWLLLPLLFLLRRRPSVARYCC